METTYGSTGSPLRRHITNTKTGERRVILYDLESSKEDEVELDVVVKNHLYRKIYVNKNNHDINQFNKDVIAGKRGSGKPTKKQVEEYLKHGIEYLPQTPIP